MTTTVKWMIIISAEFLVAACSPPRLDDQSSSSSAPLFSPKATVQDLMQFEIDPAADFIWGSVGTVITRAGVDDRQPRTDEEWEAVRQNAVKLVEATNLLIIPGRHVATREFQSDGPGVLSSAEIERKLEGDQASFNAFALSLRDTGTRVLAAVEKKDAAALSEAGEAMDDACEACHLANWYPHQVIPPLPDFK